jgi:RNA polymerase sigma-70 factor (ECF subfamily)
MDLKELNTEKKQIELAKRDINEFAPIYEKYYADVFRFVYSRMDSKENTSDICSSVFVKAMKNLQKFEYRNSPILAWLLRIAANEVKQFYRKKKIIEKYFIDQKNLNSLNYEINENDEKSKLLIESLEYLPHQDYELIHMKYFENKSFQEISIILNKSEQSLRVKAHRLKKTLKEIIIKISKSKEVEIALSLSLLVLTFLF